MFFNIAFIYLFGFILFDMGVGWMFTPQPKTKQKQKQKKYEIFPKAEYRLRFNASHK